jgi:competence protein ComEA
MLNTARLKGLFSSCYLFERIVGMKKYLLLLLAGLMLSVSAFAAVNLNTATQAELESLKGVGPAKAKAIIAYRQKNGGFKSVDDLDSVAGFGKKTVDKLRADLSINGATTAALAKPMVKPAVMPVAQKPLAKPVAPAVKPAIVSKIVPAAK